MKFNIITGRSGSGKSSCLHLLEDLGYTCIDNLPISILSSVGEHLPNKEKIAIGVDIRNLPEEPESLNEIIQQLKKQNIDLNVIYLDSTDQVLLERFSATRRKHPLSDENTSLSEALKIETKRLEPLEQLAKYRIDTSHLSIHQLRQQIKEMENVDKQNVCILFQSFGFMYGLPLDSDYVFDVRCLPNPYWDPKLRPKIGKDSEIIDFFAEKQEVKKMLHDISTFVEDWLPAFRADNHNYVTISVGCTGGQHRSVYITECLYKHFKRLEAQEPHLLIRHRELDGDLA